MATIKRKICNKHGIYEGNRCPKCDSSFANKIYNKIKRDKKSQNIYKSARWKRLRAIVLKRDGGVCTVCGTIKGRMIVDHIKEIKDGGEAFNLDNLQVLCISCHNKKTAAEKMGRVG